MKQFLITIMSVLILIFTACAVDVEIKVTRQQAPVTTPADITLAGSAIVGERNFKDVSLPWSHSFTSEEGKIVIVRTCCGLQAGDFGMRVEVYKDGSIVGSENGYSPTVRVTL